MVLNRKFPIPPLREYFITVPTIKKSWFSKNPLQKFSYFYGLGKYSGKVIGLTIFQKDQTLVWCSFVGFVLIAIYTVFAVYTMVYYLLEGQFMKSLPSTCMIMGPVYSNLPFLFFAVSNGRRKLHTLVAFSGKYLFPDHHEDAKYKEICSKLMDDCMKSFLFKFFTIFGSFSIGMLKTFYASIFLGIKTTTTDVKFPFIGEKSSEEFIFNFMLQNVIATFGFFGYFCLEGALGLLILVVISAPQLIDYELQKLDYKIERNELTSLQIMSTFRNIIQQIMDADSFIIAVRDVFYWRSMVAPLSFTYSIAMSIFCEYTMEFHVGYGLAGISYVQLYYLCDMANIIKDDGTCEIIYDTKWYALPIEQQKIVLLLINRKQNGSNLTIGPLPSKESNRETFGIITQKIYSFVMFLLNFFE